MVKVYGPMHSDDARGKFGNSMVFMGWKGIQTVRRWLKPTNPKKPKQGNVRCLIGGIGRAIGKVVKDSAFHTQLIDLALIPDKQSKQSYLVQYIKDNYLGGKGATMTGAYTTQRSAFTVHGGVDDFTAAGETLSIADFSLDYDSIPTFSKGFGLYLLGLASIALEFTGTPYTKTFASWTADRINAMIADMTGSG